MILDRFDCIVREVEFPDALLRTAMRGVSARVLGDAAELVELTVDTVERIDGNAAVENERGLLEA